MTTVNKYTRTNGYDAKAGVSAGDLTVGSGEKTVIANDKDSDVVVNAADLSIGTGEKRVISNGHDAKVVVSAGDLTVGSGEGSVISNGYDAKVIADAASEVAGTGKETLVNGYYATIMTGVSFTPPNPGQLVVWIDGTTENYSGGTYLVDKKGDQLRDVHPAVYTNTGAITQLQFTDLSGLSIEDYQGNGTAVISSNNVNITGTEFSSVKFDNGEVYSLEFLDGTTIKGVQSCTVVGTFTTDTTLRYKSYRNLTGYNESESFNPTYLANFVIAGESVPTGVRLSSDGLIMWVCGAVGDKIYQYYLSEAWDITTSVLDYPRAGFNNAQGMAWSADGLKGSIIMNSLSSDYIEFSVSIPFDIGSSYSKIRTLTLSEIASGYDIEFNLDGTKMFVSTSAIIWEWDLSTPYNATTRTEANQFNVTANVSSARGISFNSDGTQLMVAQNSPSTVVRYSLSTAFDTTTAVYVDTSSISITASGLYWKDSDNTIYTAANSGDQVMQYVSPNSYIPSDPSDPTKDTDGEDLVYYGRARYDILKDGTNWTMSASPEVYAVSLNFSTSPWFTGETPKVFTEASIVADYESEGYWLSDLPESLVYNTAQV